MAKQSVIQRNLKRIRLVKKYRKKRSALKKIIMDKNMSMQERLIAQIKLDSLPRDSSFVRVRNRCLITGRPRGNFRKFKMSRSMLRSLGSSGFIPGLRKASL